MDYAAKQWSGMFRHYYLPRWQFYFQYIQVMLKQNQTFDAKLFKQILLEKVELPFTLATNQQLTKKADSK